MFISFISCWQFINLDSSDHIVLSQAWIARNSRSGRIFFQITEQLRSYSLEKNICNHGAGAIEDVLAEPSSIESINLCKIRKQHWNDGHSSYC